MLFQRVGAALGQILIVGVASGRIGMTCEDESRALQIRIGQQDQNSAINTQQYAGYTFDNLRFSTWNNGIDEMTGKELINVYPNPSNGVFIINTTEKFKRLELTDLKGMLIGSYLLPESYYFELDLTNLAKSVYLANFIDENNLSHVRRLIIK